MKHVESVLTNISSTVSDTHVRLFGNVWFLGQEISQIKLWDKQCNIVIVKDRAKMCIATGGIFKKKANRHDSYVMSKHGN